jgi:vacuolar protein sorting-associated protein 13D
VKFYLNVYNMFIRNYKYLFQVNAPHICVCVIDDCRDSDFPILELSVSQLSLKQEMDVGGTVKFILASDYFNHVLSGWEPFIEPWQ